MQRISARSWSNGDLILLLAISLATFRPEVQQPVPKFVITTCGLLNEVVLIIWFLCFGYSVITSELRHNRRGGREAYRMYIGA